MGVFHATTIPKISKPRRMVRKCPGKDSSKSRNYWISQRRTIEPKRKSNGTEIPDRKFQKISVYLTRLSSFLEFPENAVPFVTWNFRKFKPEFFIERKAPFYDEKLFLKTWLEPQFVSLIRAPLHCAIIKSLCTGADPGFFLEGAAPLRNGLPDWWGKQILKANTKNKASYRGGEGGCAPPAPSP